MQVRKSGSATSLWNNASVSSNGLSSKLWIEYGTEQITLYIKSSNAATFTVLSAHAGALTPEGNEADRDTPPADAEFYPLYYIDTPLSLALGSAGSAAIIIPDFGSVGWLMLKCSASSTVTAGHSVSGE